MKYRGPFGLSNEDRRMEELKKVCRYIKEFTEEFIIALFGLLFFPLGFVFDHDLGRDVRVRTKIIIILMYILIIFASIIKPVIILVILGIGIPIAGFMAADLAKYFVETPNAETHNAEWNTGNDHERPDCKEENLNIFTGMSPEKAKKKYHVLAKRYHPDNEDGNLEISKIISNEYDQYKNGHKE